MRYPVRRSTELAVFLASGAMLGLGAGVAWGFLGAGRMPLWALALAALLWLACSATAGMFWCRSPHGDLAWSGSHWCFEGASGAMQYGSVGVHLDLQARLWLCFQPEIGAAQWLWLEQPCAPERWSDLRRAVYSRAKLSHSGDGTSGPSRGRHDA